MPTASAISFFSDFFNKLLNKEIDVDTDGIGVILLDGTYTPNGETQSVVADLSGELTDAGYARGTLPGVSLTNISGGVRIDSTGTVVWGPGQTLTDLKWAVFYNVATNDLLWFTDLRNGGAAQTVNNGTFTITPPATGWSSFTGS